jgi:hypothetical protein
VQHKPEQPIDDRVRRLWSPQWGLFTSTGMCERFWQRSALQLLMPTGGNAIITETHPISDLLQKLVQTLGSLSDALLSISVLANSDMERDLAILRNRRS